MVPDGWSAESLADITKEKISYGIVQAGPHIEDGVPYIKSSDVNGEIVVASLQRTSNEIHYKYRRSAVHPDDIVFSLRGNIGVCAIVPPDLPEANLTQGTARISVNNLNSNLYAYYQLNSLPVLNRINALSKGSTFKEISLEELRKVKLPMAPLAEQTKIAKILSTWDEAIAAVEKLIENCKQQKQALMQRLLTGAIRLPGYSGDWEESRLGDLTKIYDGTHSTPKYVESGVPFYSVEHLTGGNFLKTKFISEEVYCVENKRVKLERGDVLMTRIGDIGTAKLIDWDVRASFYVSLALIKSNDSFHSSFLAHYISCHEFQRELWKRTIHVAFPKKINLGEISNCIVRLPSKVEQEAIAKIITHADSEISHLASNLTYLRAEKKALMQQLLTGKRRVKIEGVAEEVSV